MPHVARHVIARGVPRQKLFMVARAEHFPAPACMPSVQPFYWCQRVEVKDTAAIKQYLPSCTYSICRMHFTRGRAKKQPMYRFVRRPPPPFSTRMVVTCGGRRLSTSRDASRRSARNFGDVNSDAVTTAVIRVVAYKDKKTLSGCCFS